MSAVRRALSKLAALPKDERRLLLEAALLLPLVYTLQSTLPFRRWRALLTQAPLPPAAASRAPPAATPPQIAQAIERARRGVPGVYKCLPQAYAGHLLLHHHGHDSVVQVGVARDAKGGVEAHAWVELGGKILIGELPDLGRFVPLPPLVEARPRARKQ